ncbi:short chain dehydrogenase reductase [Sporothrix schenckii 1099-18]|uniref:Short chain dehydrogenase reductase n=1 Tax=Sporothrix schenckii 1099-18 TaxID=1397361 RepID=A0A0F2M6S3_SPOSC|nr:short chain dehydrogenase reductase [Sporothrix schenckii 1099-18]KJR84784.1 short chain dehydrogenase reductase [Sporothrix schenckii 1099-18]
MADRRQHPLSVFTETNYLHAFFNPGYVKHVVWAQWQTVPLPAPGHFAGQTIIVTGANVGLGLEAVRHFARLGASRVIVACRSVDKAAAAVANVKQSLTPEQAAACTLEAWDVDLGSFASVAAFGARAAKELDRLDAVVENAGVAAGTYTPLEGHESSITVNVLSTFYLALLLLPLLRRTAAQHNVRPNLAVVSSDAHFFARFAEQHRPSIFAALQDPASMSHDRYNVSKLLEILVVREMAHVLDDRHIPVTVNTLNPGLCRTQLFRSLPFGVRHLVHGGLLVVGRTAEMGARTLVSAAAAGPETHGQYLDTNEVYPVSTYVTSAAGAQAQGRVWTELLGILEGVHPGISANLE